MAEPHPAAILHSSPLLFFEESVWVKVTAILFEDGLLTIAKRTAPKRPLAPLSCQLAPSNSHYLFY